MVSTRQMAINLIAITDDRRRWPRDVAELLSDLATICESWRDANDERRPVDHEKAMEAVCAALGVAQPRRP